jgi:predicted nucleic acid-binding protein
MLIVDTGPLVAYLNRNDPDHERCAMLLESRTDDLLVTPYVVTEACYLVGKYVGAEAEINLIEALAAGDLKQIDIVAGDLIRITALMRHRSPLRLQESAQDASRRRQVSGQRILAGGMAGLRP